MSLPDWFLLFYCVPSVYGGQWNDWHMVPFSLELWANYHSSINSINSVDSIWKIDRNYMDCTLILLSLSTLFISPLYLICCFLPLVSCTKVIGRLSDLLLFSVNNQWVNASADLDLWPSPSHLHSTCRLSLFNHHTGRMILLFMNVCRTHSKTRMFCVQARTQTHSNTPILHKYMLTHIRTHTKYIQYTNTETHKAQNGK